MKIYKHVLYFFTSLALLILTVAFIYLINQYIDGSDNKDFLYTDFLQILLISDIVFMITTIISCVYNLIALVLYSYRHWKKVNNIK